MNGKNTVYWVDGKEKHVYMHFCGYQFSQGIIITICDVEEGTMRP